MHKFIFALALFAAMTASLNAAAQTQDLPDPLEMAAKMADQLEKDLNLDVAQVFKIDTLFQHVYTDYYAELEKLVKSGVSSSSGQYLRVSDKWGAYIDARIEEIVDEEQWAKYLKSDAGKGKKKRDKRIAEDKY
jgi:hypothetical protein